MSRGTFTRTWFATRDVNGDRVVIRTAPPGCEATLARERTALQAVSGCGAPHVYEAERTLAEHFLAREYIDGRALTTLPPLETQAGLSLAIALTETLIRLHAAGLLHNDLRPSHVLVERGTQRAVLIDFGAATPLHGGPNVESDLRYTSPERTGRTNLPVDFRSDLYSLGCTLYFAVTGRPPFVETDPLSMIHAHLAKVPPPPVTLVQSLPAAVSRLLMKLLAKDPSDRYQTARALLVDLNACADQLERFGEIDDALSLGRADVPELPTFSQRLYGREAEVETLLALFAQARRGEPRTCLVTGAAGLGKFSLVGCLRPETVRANGYFARARFEEQKRGTPFYGLIAALNDLVHQLLAEGDTKLRRWREQLFETLGRLVGVVVEFLPDVGAIVGEIDPVPDLAPDLSFERLALALNRFVAAVARPEHPLVLVLDDLQWADVASRALIEHLVRNVPGNCALLLVVTARNASASDRTSLEQSMRALERAPVAPVCVSLGPLDGAAITAMLADALDADPSRVADLAEIVGTKTGGSALLVQQFIYLMQSRGSLYHEYPSGWCWDEAEIARAEVPDDAVEMMVSKVESLTAELRDLLLRASCAGPQFDVTLLAELCDSDATTIAEQLSQLGRTGLVVTSAHGFGFAHDRIREAAYLLCPVAIRDATHLRAARALIREGGDAPSEQTLFRVADHLRAALARIEASDRHAGLDVLARAGELAHARGAGASAREYFDAGRQLLHEEDWTHARAAAIRVVAGGAAVALDEQDLDEAEALLDALEARDLTPRERVRSAACRLRLAVRHHGELGVLPCVRQQARYFGIRWPQRPSVLRLAWALLATDHMLRGRGRELFQAPLADSPESARARGDFLHSVVTYLITAGSPLLVLALRDLLRLERRYGHHWSPGYALAGCAFIAAISRRYAKALRYHALALEWAERVPDPRLNLRSKIGLAIMFAGFAHTKRRAVAELLQLETEARELGDTEFAAFAIGTRLQWALLVGTPCPEAKAMLDTAIRDTSRPSSGAAEVGEELDSHWRLARDAFAILEADQPELDALAANTLASADAQPPSPDSNVRLWTFVVLALLARERAADAQSASLIARRSERHCPVVPEYDVARAWAVAACALAERRRLRIAERRELRSRERKLDRLSRHGNDVAYLTDVLRAERLCLSGSVLAGSSLLAGVAQGAEAAGACHFAALAQHRRYLHLLNIRRETEAEQARERAILLYDAWGAPGPAHDLRSPR